MQKRKEKKKKNQFTVAWYLAPRVLILTRLIVLLSVAQTRSADQTSDEITIHSHRDTVSH